MALLACRDYVLPILKVLSDAPGGLTGAALSERVAQLTAITEEDAASTIADGTPKYLVRIKQARYWLKGQGYVSPLAGGGWGITQEGSALLRSDGESGPRHLSRKGRGAKEPSRRGVVIEKRSQCGDPGEAPLEVIDTALRQMSDAVQAELLQRLGQLSPLFFEVHPQNLWVVTGSGRSPSV